MLADPLSVGGAGGTHVIVPIRDATDWSGWGKRYCSNRKCKDLDEDPVSSLYINGQPCDTRERDCMRSSAYLYCACNNLQYHRLNDKFYNPEKKN